MKQPKLRFKNYKDPWKSMLFGKMGKFLKGKGISKDDLSSEGVPCILYGELYTTYKNEVINSVVSKTNNIPVSPIYSKKNDVIIPSSTNSTALDISVARCVMQDNVLFGGDLNIVRLQDVDGRFISYQLNHKRKTEIAKLSQGSTIIHLYNDSLKKILLHIPSLDEQRHIADFLSTVDRRIDLQRQLVDETRRLKTSVSQMLFSQKVRFKDDDGRKYPKPKDVRLVDITTYSSSNLLLSDVLKANEGNYLVYDATGPIKRIPYFVSEKPYIGIVKDGAVGRLFLCEAKTSVVSTFGMIYNKKEVSLEFLYHFMNQINFKKFILGSTIPHVYYKDYSKITMPLPTMNEQIKISRVLTLLDDKIKKEEEKLLALEALKKGLLQQMFV